MIWQWKRMKSTELRINNLKRLLLRRTDFITKSIPSSLDSPLRYQDSKDNVKSWEVNASYLTPNWRNLRTATRPRTMSWRQLEHRRISLRVKLRSTVNSWKLFKILTMSLPSRNQMRLICFQERSVSLRSKRKTLGRNCSGLKLNSWRPRINYELLPQNWTQGLKKMTISFLSWKIKSRKWLFMSNVRSPFKI